MKQPVLGLRLGHGRQGRAVAVHGLQPRSDGQRAAWVTCPASSRSSWLPALRIVSATAGLTSRLASSTTPALSRSLITLTVAARMPRSYCLALVCDDLGQRRLFTPMVRFSGVFCPIRRTVGVKSGREGRDCHAHAGAGRKDKHERGIRWLH
jgi:hypothetical protein